MVFNLTVTVGDGGSFTHTADDAAALVLEALGGDPAADVCYVSVVQSSQGVAGTPATAEPIGAPASSL